MQIAQERSPGFALPYGDNDCLRAMVKAILREGGHVNTRMARVVPKEGSILAEPIGDLNRLFRTMLESGEIVPYEAKKAGMSGTVYGMKGIMPDVCKAQTEWEAQVCLLEQKLHRALQPNWINIKRHPPRDQQNIVALVPELKDLGFTPIVMGVFHRDTGKVHVALPARHPSTGRVTHTFTAAYEFSHWKAACKTE